MTEKGIRDCEVCSGRLEPGEPWVEIRTTIRGGLPVIASRHLSARILRHCTWTFA